MNREIATLVIKQYIHEHYSRGNVSELFYALREATAAEEALKAMERERRATWEPWTQKQEAREYTKMDDDGALCYVWHSQSAFGPIGGSPSWQAAARHYLSDALKERDQLRSELAAAKEEWGKWHSLWERETEYFQDANTKLVAVMRERDNFQAKVRELKGFLVDKKVHRDSPFIWSFVTKLFPDPKPEPEPQIWSWALEELREGRKVRWEGWPKNEYLYLDQDEAITVQECGGGVAEMCFELKHFTEPGWLPYED